MMQLDQVIQKVQKLLRLAESDNEHEAQLAADRAAELMQKYKIQSAMLNLDETTVKVESTCLWNKASVDWHMYLAAGVAEINDCGIWVHNRRSLMICGSEGSLQITNFLFHYLLRTIRKLSRMYLVEFYGSSKGKGLHAHRMAFAAGCVSRVCERLKEKKHSREQSAEATHGCQALTVINKERQEVETWMRSNLNLRPARRRAARGGQAYADGRAAGDLVSIRDGLNSGGRDPRQLGGK